MRSGLQSCVRKQGCHNNYEAGKNRPDFDGLIALADYFDVSLDYLVGRSDRRERNP